MMLNQFNGNAWQLAMQMVAVFVAASKRLQQRLSPAVSDGFLAVVGLGVVPIITSIKESISPTDPPPAPAPVPQEEESLISKCMALLLLVLTILQLFFHTMMVVRETLTTQTGPLDWGILNPFLNFLQGEVSAALQLQQDVEQQQEMAPLLPDMTTGSVEPALAVPAPGTPAIQLTSVQIGP